MNEKFNKNAKVENFTTMLGIAVRLIVIDPWHTIAPTKVLVHIGAKDLQSKGVEGPIFAFVYIAFATLVSLRSFEFDWLLNAT